jgi:hypothetical protein
MASDCEESEYIVSIISGDTVNYYCSLADAVDSVPTSKVETTIDLI